MLPLRGAVFAGFLLASIAISAADHATTAQRQAEAELLAVHQQDRRAHLEHNVDLLLEHAGPQLLDVRDGKVSVVTREQTRANFTDYFSRAKISVWDDVQSPVVHASEDGRLGWMVVRVHIVYTSRDRSGQSGQHDSMMAWMAAYEKRNGKWVMTAVTSTSEK